MPKRKFKSQFEILIEKLQELEGTFEKMRTQVDKELETTFGVSIWKLPEEFLKLKEFVERSKEELKNFDSLSDVPKIAVSYSQIESEVLRILSLLEKARLLVEGSLSRMFRLAPPEVWDLTLNELNKLWSLIPPVNDMLILKTQVTSMISHLKEIQRGISAIQYILGPFIKHMSDGI